MGTPATVEWHGRQYRADIPDGAYSFQIMGEYTGFTVEQSETGRPYLMVRMVDGAPRRIEMAIVEPAVVSTRPDGRKLWIAGSYSLEEWSIFGVYQREDDARQAARFGVERAGDDAVPCVYACELDITHPSLPYTTPSDWDDDE